MSFGDDTLDPANRFTRCAATRKVVHELQCIGQDGHGGNHIDHQGEAFEVPKPPFPPKRATPLQLAALVTGNVQTSLEQLHELTTYELSSAMVNRHRDSFEIVRKSLTAARNAMAGLALALGKEGT